MFTIGVLLPGSTLYPSIGLDFLEGIRAGFKFHQFADVDIKAELISFGLKNDEIYVSAEKLLLIGKADVVVAYAGDHHAEKLAPLFTAAGKLLIIANAGANYPFYSENTSHTLFHTLNDSLYSFMTGKYAARQEGGHGAILTTSFFDGGYTHVHAMTNAFMLSGGQLMYNFVSHYKKEEFSTDALAAFIKDNPEIKKILSVFSGDMARLFFEKIKVLQQENKLQCYASPMMFDATPGDFAESKPDVPDMCGFTNWVPGLDNETNHAFLQFYKEEHGKDANLFSMHGWENALLLMKYLQVRKETANTESALEKLKNEKINSPRGIVSLNEQRHITGPAHFAEASGKLKVAIKESVTDLQATWEEMYAQIPREEGSSWRNTYLCI